MYVYFSGTIYFLSAPFHLLFELNIVLSVSVKALNTEKSAPPFYPPFHIIVGGFLIVSFFPRR